jgi:uncharacterized protein involved in response to NO
MSTLRPAAPARMAWRFGQLFEAPHRLAFAAGTLMLALTSLWWALVNLSGFEGMGVRWAMPPATAHSVLMTFGFMPFFFVGFLFTAGPKWLGQPPVPARHLVGSMSAMVAGWLVFLLSVHGRDSAFAQSVGTIGLSAVLLGWSGISRRFIAMVRASVVPDRVHAKLVAVASLTGVLMLAGAVVGVARGDFGLVRAATQGALWGFIGLMFAAVSHRMIPFFSAAAVPALDAWRPLWLLGAFVAVFVGKAVGSVAGALTEVSAPGWLAAQAAAELAAGAAFVALAVRWGLVQSLRVRLLAMLHLGFTWLGVGLLMEGAAHAIAAGGGPNTVFGLAPLHAYSMGFLGSTMFAMVTRVSCGHGGRTLVADDFVWRLFWVLQMAIVARLAAAFARDLSGTWNTALVAAAAVGWAGVCLAWAVRYGRWYGTPRPDGRPG